MTALQRLIYGLADLWCGRTHGGGWIMRDPSGRVNWQCNKCGRWADPVSAEAEAAMTDAAISRAAEDTRGKQQ
jgi:hypothetical protein